MKKRAAVAGEGPADVQGKKVERSTVHQRIQKEEGRRNQNGAPDSMHRSPARRSLETLGMDFFDDPQE